MNTKTQPPHPVGSSAWLGRFVMLLVGIAFCAVATFGMRESFTAACVVEGIGIAIQCVAFFYRPNDKVSDPATR